MRRRSENGPRVVLVRPLDQVPVRQIASRNHDIPDHDGLQIDVRQVRDRQPVLCQQPALFQMGLAADHVVAIQFHQNEVLDCWTMSFS